MKLKAFFALLPLAVASCSDTMDYTPKRPAEMIRVEIGSGRGVDIESRTALDPDGVTVRWTEGDQIALWAEKGGSYTLNRHPFTLWHYNEQYNDAKFTADIPAMEEGTYNYYAVSPQPAATNGTQASYDIPSVQDGSYMPACDVMVADPITGGSLVSGDNSQTVNLRFQHKTHILRITIPSNNFSEEVSEMEILFPVPVTGRMTVDAANPSAAPTLTDGKNLLTLRFAQPLKVGDVVYAMIAPVDIPAEQTISFTVLDPSGESAPNQIPGKNFAAGHTTPIAYHLPTKAYNFTVINFALPAGKGTNTLGEEVEKIKLTAPAGSDFGNGSNLLEFTPTPSGSYSIKLRAAWDDALSGKTIEAEYESESAIVKNSFTMPQITRYAANTKTFAVPYLMEEDFSSVQTYSNGEGNNNGDPAAIWIPGLSDWSAARTGGSAGKCVRIVGRREGGMWVFVNYMARMDSSPLKNLKEGKTTRVKISFNYSGATSGNTPKMRYGTSNAQGNISGANEGIEAQAGDINASTNGSYDRVDKAITPFTATATRSTRLAWVAYGDNGGFSGGWWYYIYIDNVKVSISK